MNKKLKIFFGVLLICLIVTVIAFNIIRSTGKGTILASGPIIEVEAKKVRKGNINGNIIANGTVDFSKKTEIYFDSPVKVNKIYVEQFEQVKKGQKLLDLDYNDLTDQLEQARIALKIQELTVNKSVLMSSVKNLDSLENQVKSAEEALDFAKDNLDRVQALYENDAASRLEVKNAEKSVDDAQIALQNAKSNLEDGINNNEKALDAANIDLQIQKANLEAGRLRVKELERKLQEYENKAVAPIDGIVTEINMHEGEGMSAAQPGIVISDFEMLEIRANINEADKNSLKVGQQVDITSSAIDKSIKITGKIESISPIAKSIRAVTGEEKIFETVIAINNPSEYINVLSPGQNVDCDIVTNVAENALICSFDMINDDKDGQKYVFVVDNENNTVKKQYITLGIISELDAEVKNGLTGEELVVVDPPLNLKDGSNIRTANKDKN